MKINSVNYLLLAGLLLGFAGVESCKQDDTTVVTPTSATVSALTCGSVIFSTTAVSGAAYTATATVPYTGGNGAAYAAGTAVASTGVTGLSATLQAGTLASGAGNLTYSVSGTPSGSGTASFALGFGGQTCTLSLVVSATTTTPGTSTVLTGTGSVSAVLTAANAFLATLTTAQQTTVQLALTKANAVRWSNLPGGVSIRNGLEFSTLTAAQLTAAKAVIQAAAGTGANEGYAEFLQINAADDVLRTTYSAGNSYSSGEYIIAFLGTPSATGTWMLQFGGHHYAQNITFSNGSVVSGTPTHMGVEPREWSADGNSYAPLNQGRTAIVNMLASLSTAQLATAKLSATFGDVLLGAGKDGQFPATKQGLAVSTLNADQKLLVLAAIQPWVNDLDDVTARALLTVYQQELDQTYIAYSNNATMTANADYARVDGPSVWVEFVVQSGAVIRGDIHYHTIFRDHKRDYNGL